MDLQKLRGEIDAIDTQMTDLFVKRLSLIHISEPTRPY